MKIYKLNDSKKPLPPFYQKEGRGGFLITPPKLKKYASKNRKYQTKCEKLLWHRIRKDQLGVRVLRQKVISKYIADFYIAKYKLIIEVDGESHVGKEKYDARRTVHLQSLGYIIIRFWDYEVQDDIGNVVERILGSFRIHPLPLFEMGGNAISK